MNDENNTSVNNEDSSGGIFGSTPLIMQSQTNQTSNDSQKDESQKSDDTQVIDSEEIITVPSEPTTPVPEATQNTLKNKEELSSMGVTFVDETPQEEKNIFSKDSSFKEKEQEQIIAIKPVETPKSEAVQAVETKDLEADFSQTFNTPIISSTAISDEGGDALGLEEQKLKRLYSELKDKASKKKIIVKERLEKLRVEKEALGKELEDIKEIEALATTIDEKLKNLQAMDTELDSIEKKANEELHS